MHSHVGHLALAIAIGQATRAAGASVGASVAEATAANGNASSVDRPSESRSLQAWKGSLAKAYLAEARRAPAGLHFHLSGFSETRMLVSCALAEVEFGCNRSACVHCDFFDDAVCTLDERWRASREGLERPALHPTAALALSSRRAMEGEE